MTIGLDRDQHVNRRVVLVTTALDIGALGLQLAEIAPLLRNRGFDISIACLSHLGLLAPSISSKGVPVTGSGTFRFEPWTLGLGFGAARFYGELRRQRPAIVHFFDRIAYLAGAHAAALAGVPIRILSRRGDTPRRRNHRGFKKLEKHLHRSTDFFLGNSVPVLDELINQEGASPDRIGLIHDGMDLSRFAGALDTATARARLGIAKNTLVLITVGDLAPHKGHRDLITALAQLRGQLIEPWLLLVLGRDAGAGAAIEAAAHRFRISEKIRFLGARTDIADLLRLSDIGILASHREGISATLIESAAAGLPMVVSNAGNNAALVIDGVTGLVVPPQAPDALAAAIGQLASDAQLSQRLGRAAKRRAFEDFALTGVADQYTALYEALLAGKPVGPRFGEPGGEGVANSAATGRTVH